MSPRSVFCTSILALALAIPVIVAARPPITTNPVPFLNPIVPAATVPSGTAYTLTVTGTGFVSGSVVDWNGSPLATTFVSGSKLTATVPAADTSAPGTAAISVINPAPGGGTSNQQTFEVTSAAAQIFWSTRDITGNVPLTSFVVGGDFNKDGKYDIAVAAGASVYVIPGNGDGTFQPAIGSAGPANSMITGLHVYDVNEDGTLDLIITGRKGTTSFVATMIGNGNGTFQSPIETDFSGLPSASAVFGDFSGDGSLDFAFVTATSVQTMVGNGDGTFHTGPSSPINLIGTNAIAAGDFNGDGKLDLVASVYDPFTTGFFEIAVLPGNGDGSFGSPNVVPGSGTSYVGAITAAVGDFNGDGKLDIASAYQTAGPVNEGFVTVSLGNGDGTFQSAYYVPNVNNITTPLLIGDFNGDGKLDLSTGGFFYFGQGDGTFPTSNGSTGAPTFVLAGDFNNDGQMDVVDETVTLHGSTTLTAIGLELQVSPLPDFKGIVGPLNTVLVPGGTASFTVNLQPLYGFTGDVILGMTNLPNGISPSYNPVTVPGGSGSSTITLTASNGLQLGNYNLTLSGNSGTLTHSTIVPVEVNVSAGDFYGTVSPTTQNIAPGHTTSYQITMFPTGGFNANVTLSVSGLPAGVTASFSQNPVIGGSGPTTLNVTVPLTSPQPQIYSFQITGTSGILTHTTTAYLGVSSSGGDFTGTITPTQTVAAGGTVTYFVALSPISGGAGDVGLTVNGLPAGATATFTPLTILGSNGTSTLSVVTAPGTTPGNYALVISLAGAGVIHLDGVNLTVTAQ
ncbi:MAG TPA: FG-GAP-like repeat-containing protein [Candidatus Saccharimonadales bacterium]|nr:FG-GAP-like repeat-containing protein [Candidatus Saccharimonadales bacterium]